MTATLFCLDLMYKKRKQAFVYEYFCVAEIYRGLFGN